jgi:plasmid stabilization system protein ParE
MVEEIVKEVLWTDAGKDSFNAIIEYLDREWTEKEIEKFIWQTNQMLSKLKRYPEICRLSKKRKNVRIGILNKRTQLVYSYSPSKKRIEILLFWGMNQDPAKLSY